MMGATTPQTDAMQAALMPMAASPDALRANASSFWHNQDKLLDSMQDFAAGWFERRHTGTRQALDAAQCICTARNPADAIREYQTWLAGAVDRSMKDCLAMQRLFASLDPLPTLTERVEELEAEVQSRIKQADHARVA